MPDMAAWVAEHAQPDDRVASLPPESMDAGVPLLRRPPHDVSRRAPKRPKRSSATPQPFYCLMRRSAYDEFVAHGAPLRIVHEREGMGATSGRVLWRTYTPLVRFVVVVRAVGSRMTGCHDGSTPRSTSSSCSSCSCRAGDRPIAQRGGGAASRPAPVRSARCGGAVSVPRAAAARLRSRAATRGRTSTTWARPAAACGRRPTAACPGSRSPTARSTLVGRRGRGRAVEPGHRLHRHRRSRHPRQHHPGRRRLQVHRRRQDVDAHRPRRDAGDREDPRPPDQSRPRLRRGFRSSRGAEPRTRRLPVQGRRQDVGEDSVPRQQDRRRRTGHRPEEPAGDLRRAVGGVPQRLRDVERRPRQRHLQDHRRRRSLDGDLAQPRPAEGDARQDRLLGFGRRLATASTRRSKRRTAASSCPTMPARRGRRSTRTAISASARSTTRASTPIRRSRTRSGC